MRIIKWISLGLAGLLLLIVLGLLVLVWVIDPNQFKSTIAARVKQATGRDLTLSGNIELGFFPWLAVRTGPGSFGNAPGFGPQPMASWSSAQLGARLLPLLRGEIVIDRVRLNGAEVQLVRHADGGANWQGIGSGEAVDPNAPARHVTIDGVDLVGSHLVFDDQATPRRIEINALSLTTDAIAPDQPFTGTEIGGVLHMEGFAAAGVPFRVEVPRAELTRNYSKLEVEKLTLKFGGFEVSGGISGEFADSTRLAGKFTSNIFDARELLGSVGIEAPKTTDPKALTRIAVQTSWRFDDGAITLDPLVLALDDTHFTGHFRRDGGDDPVGEFGLRGDRLDLSRYIPPSDPASEPFVLPTAELRALRFRGVLELDQATMDEVVMKGVTLRLLLDEHGLHSPDAGAPDKT